MRDFESSRETTRCAFSADKDRFGMNNNCISPAMMYRGSSQVQRYPRLYFSATAPFVPVLDHVHITRLLSDKFLAESLHRTQSARNEQQRETVGCRLQWEINRGSTVAGPLSSEAQSFGLSALFILAHFASSSPCQNSLRSFIPSRQSK